MGEAQTLDALFRGEVQFWQPAKGHGYRFNMDSVFLAHFARPGESCVDLGAGCGVVGLLMLHTKKVRHITLVERQPTMAAMCRQNALENGFTEQAEIVEADLRQVSVKPADTVVFNPPYFREGSGRGSPARGKDEARFERFGTVGDFLATASDCVTPAGAISLIVRAERYDEIIQRADAKQLYMRREQFLVSRVGDSPRNVLVEFSKSRKELPSRLPDLVIHSGAGREYTQEVSTIFEDSNSWTTFES